MRDSREHLGCMALGAPNLLPNFALQQVSQGLKGLGLFSSLESLNFHLSDLLLQVRTLHCREIPPSLMLCSSLVAF